MESWVSKRYLNSHVHSSGFLNSQKVEATQVCVNRCMGKAHEIYTDNGMSFTRKKDILTYASMRINPGDLC